MDYENFTIQIGPNRDKGFIATVLETPEGGAGEPFELSNELSQLNEFLVAVARSAHPTEQDSSDSSRELDTEEDEHNQGRLSAEDIGEQLFRSLFTGKVHSLYQRNLGRLSQSGKGLRINMKLAIEGPGMAHLNSLPWEYLYQAENREFIALNSNRSLVRYLDVSQPFQRLDLPRQLRILIIISNPTHFRQLDLGREQELIKNAWGRHHNVEIEFLNQADLQILRRRLSQKSFHILHFMGHGGFDVSTGEGVLYFEDENRNPRPITGAELATNLQDQTSLRLIFLNACNSAKSSASHGLNPFAGVATALVSTGLPAVLAMQYKISDRAAITFSEVFYHGLAEGETLDRALVEGRLALHNLPRREQHSIEWGTPVLYMRTQDGRLFETLPWPHRLLRRIPHSVAWIILSFSLLVLLGLAYLPEERPRVNPRPLESIVIQDWSTEYNHLILETLFAQMAKEAESRWNDISPPSLPELQLKPIKPVPKPRLKSGTHRTDEVSGLELSFIRGEKRSEDIWSTKTEITNKQWRQLLAEDPPSLSADLGPDFAVESVNWFEALLLANKASELSDLDPCYLWPAECTGQEGRTAICENVQLVPDCTGYRLPTAEEWWRAARGPNGDTQPTPENANCDWARAAPAGVQVVDHGSLWARPRSFAPNAWKLYDMFGNVWEWVWTEASAGSKKQALGGSFDLTWPECKGELLREESPETRDKRIGFRLVRSAQSD